ncbi:SET domain-containing protein [Cinnamomum micranthum f. kanehirae]|uniref:SET domain-containing protein n=1 Tax=Cinnamomum micranthum f. kanehirae TaxID=337451 RepID=A0A3S3PAQ5_9MAGN|nr:SET domain-containing protein [Cinnamomum micranthum f. kanehirae]
MVELEEIPSDTSVVSGSRIKSDVQSHPVRKRSLEIDDGMPLDRPVGFCRQKLPAIRDFPSEFGKIHQEIDGKWSDGGSFGLPGVFVGSELPKSAESSDQMALSDSVVDLPKPKAGELLMCIDQSGFLQPFNNLEVEIANHSELVEMPSSLGKTEPVVSQGANVKMLDTTDTAEGEEENVPKIYPPSRRISGHRDFPFGCGRDAQPMPKEEVQEGFTLGSKKAYEDCPSVEMDGNLNDIKDTAGKSEGGVIKETEGEGEFLSGKLVVLSKIAGEEEKEGEPVVGYIQRSVPNEKNNKSFKRNTDSLEGKIATRKSTRISKSSFRHKNNAFFKDEEDSLPHGDGEKRVAPCQELSLTLIPFGPNPSGKSDDPRRKVRETLRLFQAMCRKLLREEEANPDLRARTSGRIDLTAVKLLKKENLCVNTGMPILGAVPGVEVGDEFHFRVELAIIGLHRPYQSGIDYMKQNKIVLATSVVASGGYEDDMDGSDVLIYSGQGGKPAGVDKQAEDQKLERGNLALKNSIDAETPVRVIHGFKELRGSDTQDVKGKKIITYTYNGLYLVENYWQERGDHGRFIFKFQMRRLPGQPELAIKEIKKSKKSAEREGLCIADISQGKEKIAICVVNTIDDERPLPVEYTTTMIYPPWYIPTVPRGGCDCTDGCSDSKKCVCVNKNGGEIPFNHDGAIVEAKRLVYECGPSCKCPPSCYNRVSQHGITFKLEVFKTISRGWGVRSLTSIPSGSFICEYAGELLNDKEAERRISNDEYLFDIGRNYSELQLWEGQSSFGPTDSQSSAPEKVTEDAEYTIDAAKHGNVGRFINHSCSPNLYAQNVLFDHDDESKPHVMLFAAENIPPLQELTYHYNYKIGEVRDSCGNIKQKNCYCGSHECTGRLY